MWLRAIALVLSLSALLVLLASGPGARLGLWDWRLGLGLLRYAAYLGIAAAAVSLVGLVIPQTRGKTLVLALEHERRRQGRQAERQCQDQRPGVAAANRGDEKRDQGDHRRPDAKVSGVAQQPEPGTPVPQAQARARTRRKKKEQSRKGKHKGNGAQPHAAIIAAN